MLWLARAYLGEKLQMFRRSFSGPEETPAQWYLALTPDARIDRLEASASIAIGLPANVGVHVMTGTLTSARSIAADAQVRWVGPRPRHHKLDSTLRQFLDPTVERRAAPVPNSSFSDRGGVGSIQAGADALAEFISIRTLVATLVSPRTHSRAGTFSPSHPTSTEAPGFGKQFGVSTQEFVNMCNEEFDKKGWGSQAVVVSGVCVCVSARAHTLGRFPPAPDCVLL